MSQISRLLLKRWSGMPMGSTLEETFRKIASMVSGTKDRRSCLGVICTIAGLWNPDEGDGPAPNVPPLEFWKVFGRVSLSYHGGYLCADAPVVDVSLQNIVEGMVPLTKSYALQSPGLVGMDEPLPGGFPVRHSFCLAFADRYFSNGSPATKRITDKAFPASMMGADSDFRLVLGGEETAPAGWSLDKDGWTVSVWGLYREDPKPMPPIFQRLGTYITTEDPALIPSGFSKLESLFAADKNYHDFTPTIAPLSFATRVKLSIDDRAVYEELNVAEDIITECWMRDDAIQHIEILPGLVIPSPFGEIAQPTLRKILILLDQFASDRRSDLPAGNKIEVTGLGEVASDAVRYCYRRIDITPAGEFGIWSERENVKVSPSDLASMSVNGDPVAKLGLSRGQMLGLPIAISPAKK